MQCTAIVLGDHGHWNFCNALPHCRRATGSVTPPTQCHTAWGLWAVENRATHRHTTWGEWVVQLLQRTTPPSWGGGKCNSYHALAAALPHGIGQWNSCNAMPRCPGTMGSAIPGMHSHTAWGRQAVELVTHCLTVWGGGYWNSCKAVPHYLGAVGSATHGMHSHTAWGRQAVDFVQRAASLRGGSGHGNPCNALPHCLGAVGSGIPAIHCLTA